MFNLSGNLLWCRIAIMICIVAVTLSCLSAMVVPHPLYKNPPQIKASRPSEVFGPKSLTNPRILPMNILILRVQFSDVSFDMTADYPDSLVHDQAFFERWAFHLRDFYADASHQQYIPAFTVHNEVYNLPNPMSYYGRDTADESDVKVPHMISELIQMADLTIDYNAYDAIIVFHAGPGQESDIDYRRPGEIWSTFLSREDFQAAFDPENDNYPGLQTNDGKIIKEVVLVPESEFQDYFTGPLAGYLFSIYGVLCHQFGHQLGLPTLFDNISSNGKSQGIGNWGLMGTGVWNANGYVPAQLSAWSRYYLGWDIAETIDYDVQNLTVDHFLNIDSQNPRMYKIPISEKEYFLIENRQQNPDNSTDPHDGKPSFTFALLGEGVQDYYPAPDSLRPYFNFMENSFKGCEWDFYLPGFGGPELPPYGQIYDGSGLLIWHIDENIIERYFDPDFDYNHINGDASHKGVDLEEADGNQHLDISAVNPYKYGSPFDSFRADLGNADANNTYFGIDMYEGLFHLPTASSYYGGIPLEIYDISSSGLQMTFSVQHGWKLDTGYEGIINLDACSIDYDNDGENEICYPMPDGQLFIWKDEFQLNDIPQFSLGDTKSYAWDGSSLFFASQYRDVTTPLASLIKLTNQNTTFRLFNHEKWVQQIVLFDDYAALPLIDDNQNSFVRIINSNTLVIEPTAFHTIPDSICTNMVYFKQKFYCLSQGNSGFKLSNFTPLAYNSISSSALTIPADSIIVAMFGANITPQGGGDLVIQTPYALYLTDLQGNIRTGFPINMPFFSNAPVSISDVDKNGSFDILIGGENSIAAFDYSGVNILTNLGELSSADTMQVASGAVAGDYDGDGKLEYLGLFSRNRIALWDDNQKLNKGFPVSFAQQSRNVPFIHTASDGMVYAWAPTDNGKIYRVKLPVFAINGIDENWFCKYANLKRTASREDINPPNQYQTTSLFVPNEVFVFPNPLKSIYAQKFTFQIMTSKDAKVDFSIHDIRGNRLYQKKVQCKAWLKNRQLIDFPVDHLSSGVYIAVMKSGNEVKQIKFAVEK